jgi:hypothetical protein
MFFSHFAKMRILAPFGAMRAPFSAFLRLFTPFGAFLRLFAHFCGFGTS